MCSLIAFKRAGHSGCPGPISWRRQSGWVIKAVVMARSYTPLRPLEKLPSKAVFVDRLIISRVVDIVAAPALTSDPAAHFGCEPERFLPHRIRPRNVAIPEV